MSKDEESLGGRRSKRTSSSSFCENDAQDDDGIENFLSDAIGPVAGDVFRDITDSHTFAELLEVVTTSLTSGDGASTSRRSSYQETGDTTTAEIPEKLLTQQAPSTETSSPRKKCSTAKVQRVYENKVKDKDADLRLQSSTSEKIKNRLKVKLKFSPQQHRCDNSPKHSTKPPIKQKGTTPSKKNEASSIPTHHEVAKILLPPTKNTSKRRINEDLHKKCKANPKDEGDCPPCCVILYNLLDTAKFSEMIIPSPSNAKPKFSGTSINLCSILDEKVDEFHAYERKNRIYYQQLFNPTKSFVSSKNKKDLVHNNIRKVKEKKDKKVLPPKIQKPSVDGIINPTRSTNSREATPDSKPQTADNECIAKENITCIQDIHIDQDPGHGILHECDNMTKEKPDLLQTEISPSSVPVPGKQEITTQIEEKMTVFATEPESRQAKTQKGKSSPSPDKINNEKVDQGSRRTLLDDDDDKNIKRAKRHREMDETKREKDEKFERLEHERKRKSSETKKSNKTESRIASTWSTIKPTSSFSPTKCLAMPSFRIPKAEGVIPKKTIKPVLATPLAKVVGDDSPPHKFTRTTAEARKDKEHKNKSKARFAEADSQQQQSSSANQIKGKDDTWETEENWEVEVLPDPEDNWEVEVLPEPGAVEVKKEVQDGRDIPNLPKLAAIAGPVTDIQAAVADSQVEIEVTTDSNHITNQTTAENDISRSTELPKHVKIASPNIRTTSQANVAGECKVDVLVDEVDDGCDSTLPSNGDRTIPPHTELQIGKFTIAVTELVQKQSDVRVITFEECFSRKCDAITEKCAWWFAKCDEEPPGFDARLPRLESVTSLCGSDDGSDTSFLGNVSDSEIRDDDCQVHEISSTSHKPQDRSWNSSKVVRDPDKVDEYCVSFYFMEKEVEGRSLLQAKIRTSTGQNFRNLFDLRAGALYEKENFQAKCNLCNQLIVGKKDLATHVRGITHKENLRKLDLHMDKTTDSSTKKPANGNSSSPKSGPVIKKEKNENRTADSSHKSKKIDAVDSKGKETRIKVEREDRHARIKIESSGARVEYGTTSNGLSVKVPINDDGKIFRRSTKSPEPHDGGNKSESPSKRRRRTRSRSPPVRIPRSPLGLRKSQRSKSPDRTRRHSRRSRSRSRSPNRSSRRRRSDSEEYRHHRRSPGKSSRRGRRSRTKSKSPQLLKKDNKEFHTKLALTAEGKWTDEMEKQWKLMEAEEAVFREQFIDRRKELAATPEEHPRYGTEWTEFWERRYQEVEKEGKDPDTHNYVAEWKDYWSKRLNSLLQEEADEKIRDIKKKHKMDFDTLNVLRNNDPQKAAPPQHPDRVFFDRQTVPPPNLDPKILTVGSNSSNGSVVEFNNMSSGMSVSSGFAIKEEKDRVPERKPSISVEEFKSTWEAFTRTSSISSGSITAQGTKLAAKGQDSVFIPEFSVTTPFSQPPNRTSVLSDITSSSDGSFDFMGFDLVQVLRLMCKTEDQLSFLAPKILEYYKIAEELELKKSKGSHILLCNEELVTVLFQARDRFMTLIRSNVLGRDILQTLNLTVYGLNAILEAPQCQKFRPKVPAPFLEPVPAASAKSEEPQPPALPKIEPLPAPTDSDKEIKLLPSLVAHLSSATRTIIAGELSKYLLLMGGQNMSNSELQEFVAKMVTPLVKKSNDSWEEKPDMPDVGVKKQNQDLNNAFDINQGQGETTMLGHDYEHSGDMRITGVSGSKAVGSALPTLPHMYRSGDMDDPPSPPRGRSNRFDEPAYRPPTNNNNSSIYENLSSSQRPQSQGMDDGRQSPFSRRELSMNPVADRERGRY